MPHSASCPRCHRIVVVGLAIALLAQPASQALAQERPPAKKAEPKQEAPQSTGEASQPGWRVQCDGSGPSLDCKVSQTIVIRRTGQLLLSVVVRKPPKPEGPALMLHLPHGLFLPAGASLQFDKARSEVLQVQTCDQRGCYAGIALTKDKLTALTKAEKLEVAIQDLNKQPIAVSLSLLGFGEAYQKLP